MSYLVSHSFYSAGEFGEQKAVQQLKSIQKDTDRYDMTNIWDLKIFEFIILV